MTDPVPDALLPALRGVVGADQVITDPEVRASYETDWTGRYGSPSRCVVRPRDTAEVAAVMAVCAAHDVPVIPQGGNTGLVGGSVPRRREVVVSLRRLTRLDPVDVAAAQVTAGAGVTIDVLQDHARAAGLDFAVDWGARASATVGGAVATNAGGSRVVRFGTMRSQVMGIEAVLADGSVITDLGGLPKETVGLHLPSVLAGSEGSLAIVTAARLRLVPLYTSTAAAVVILASLRDAPALLIALRNLADLDAVEVILPGAARVTEQAFGMSLPVAIPAGGAAVLVDCAGRGDPTDQLAEAVAGYDGVLASGAQRTHLFELRDHISLAINSVGVPLKLDVAVPVECLADIVECAEKAIVDHAPQAALYAFGHLAEGNLHLNIVGADRPDRAGGPDHERDATAQIAHDVLAAAIDLGGTVSAEHGIGIAKTAWVERVKGRAATHAMRAVKHALDPAGLLNPGVLFGEPPPRPDPPG